MLLGTRFGVLVAVITAPVECFNVASIGPMVMPRCSIGMDGEATRDRAPAAYSGSADVGCASTAFYTSEVKKDSYDMLPDVLAEKVADYDMRKLMLTLFDAFATVSDALSKELVVKADEQKSVFGDVQLGVDVLADDLMWDVCKKEPLIKQGASEEEPEVRAICANIAPSRKHCKR